MDEKIILLVDDDDDLRASYAAVLEQHGHLVAQADSGNVALAYCLEHLAPALIILDIEMPQMSGWELLSILRCYSRLAGIPVLIVSGSPIDEAAKSVYPSLPKPVEPEKLATVVAELLAVARPSFG